MEGQQGERFKVRLSNGDGIAVKPANLMKQELTTSLRPQEEGGLLLSERDHFECPTDEFLTERFSRLEDVFQTKKTNRVPPRKLKWNDQLLYEGLPC